MELFKLSGGRYLNTSAIIVLSLDTENPNIDYLYASLTDGRRMLLFSTPKGTSIEDVIMKNLITINKDTDDKSIHTTPTLR